jgi:hypothetical protein
MKTAEQVVLEAFRGRTYITVGEVIALVENVMAATGNACRAECARERGVHAKSTRRRRRHR